MLHAAVAFCVCSLFAPRVAAQTHPCLPCHPREVDRFSKSAMGRSLGVPSDEPEGAFHHDASGSTVRIFRKAGQMHHQIDERGLSADYPIAYAVGAGKVGKSYLIELGGHLFQSPAAYYTAHAEWNASPGYETERLLDFTRPVTSDCLVCHVGALRSAPEKTELTPISCDRCHGDGENHRQHPVPGSIVDPAKLPVRARDSVCEQCHLETATVVLNPRKYWWDFRPGEVLESVETHYIYRSEKDDRPLGAVSQAEQLALSACSRKSAGKLWCGTCHDPHGEPAPDIRARKQQIMAICQSCHAPAQLSATHSPLQDDCVRCHMPSRQATDVAHAAITDHRIARRPATLAATETAISIAAWHQPPPELSDRNLGLAYFNTAKQKQSGPDFEQAFQLLSKLPPAQKDAPVWAAQGYMLLGTRHAAAAVECFERCVRENPERAEYWLDLAVAQDAAGKTAQAVQAFRQSIKDDPYDYRPYRALAKLYERLHETGQSEAVVREFEHLVPQTIGMRLLR